MIRQTPNLLSAVLLFVLVSFKSTDSKGFHIEPTSGHIGSHVVIDLAGLQINDTTKLTIYFHPFIKAKILTVSTVSITVVVPKGTSFGNISVVYDGFNYKSTQKFSPTFSTNVFDSSGLTFTEMRSPVLNIPKGGLQYLESGDLNTDGKPDLVTTSTSRNGITIFANTLPHNYTPASLVNAQAFASAIDIAADTLLYDVHLNDLNADGKPEVVATSSFTNKVYVYQNKSNTSQLAFEPPLMLLANAGYLSQVTSSDLNQDGKPDIIATSGQNNTITIYQNKTEDTLITQASFADTFVIRISACAPGGLYAIAAADINNDQLPDIIVSSYCDGSIYLIENASQNNSINFRNPIRFQITRNPSHMVTDDFNNDDKIDIAICHDDSLITILQNNHPSMAAISASNFTTKQLINKRSPTNQTVSNYYFISSGDLNGDGKVDLITTDWFMSTFINLNQSTVAGELEFAQQSQSLRLATPQGFGSTITDFNFDGRPDIIISKAFYNANFLDGSLYCFTNTAGFPSSTNEQNPRINSDITLYPNPASSTLYIQGTRMAPTVSIFNLQGAFIKEIKVNANEIDIAELNNGIYVIHVNDNGTIYRQLFVKE